MNVNAQTGWFDDFLRWFFNASPFWVDERKILRTPSIPHRGVERRANPRDRRRGQAPRTASMGYADRQVSS